MLYNKKDLRPHEDLFLSVLVNAWEDAFSSGIHKTRKSNGKIKKFMDTTEKERSISLFKGSSPEFDRHFKFLCMMAGVDSNYLREKFNYYYNNEEEYKDLLSAVSMRRQGLSMNKGD